MTSKKSLFDIKRIAGMALFAALAYAVTLVFHIPVSIFTFDAKDAVLTIGAFIYGPVSALIMSAIPALIEFITISSTGPWGLLMNFASSACFSLVASLIYKYRRSLGGAIVGLYAAVIATTSLMAVLNIFVTPIYQGVPRQVVIDMLPTLIVPFNFAKTLMNTAFVMFLYKPVALGLKRARLISGKMNMKFTRQSLIMSIAGALTLVGAIVLFIVL